MKVFNRFSQISTSIDNHLLYVLNVLSMKGVSRNILELLEKYIVRGNYPVHYQKPSRIYSHNHTPCFIDECGTYCAVAYLINKTINDYNLLTMIGRNNNYDYLEDIADKYPQINIWAHQYNLTIGDLSLIQPGYAYTKVIKGHLCKNKYGEWIASECNPCETAQKLKTNNKFIDPNNKDNDVMDNIIETSKKDNESYNDYIFRSQDEIRAQWEAKMQKYYGGYCHGAVFYQYDDQKVSFSDEYLGKECYFEINGDDMFDDDECPPAINLYLPMGDFIKDPKTAKDYVPHKYKSKNIEFTPALKQKLKDKMITAYERKSEHSYIFSYATSDSDEKLIE